MTEMSQRKKSQVLTK